MLEIKTYCIDLIKSQDIYISKYILKILYIIFANYISYMNNLDNYIIQKYHKGQLNKTLYMYLKGYIYS